MAGRRYKLWPTRMEGEALTVLKYRVLTGEKCVDSFSKNVGMAFGRFLDSGWSQRLASLLKEVEAFDITDLPALERAVCDILGSSELLVFDEDGSELWPKRESGLLRKALLFQIRPGKSVARKKRNFWNVHATATGWKKVDGWEPRRGPRVATLHTKSCLCCDGCGFELASSVDLISHVEMSARDSEGGGSFADPTWRKEFWKRELRRPNILCGQDSPEAREQRKCTAAEALRKLEASDSWEYSDHNVYADKLKRWKTALRSADECAVGWDLETATAGEAKPEVPDMEALAYEVAEALNVDMAPHSTTRGLVPVMVQLAAKPGELGGAALLRAAEAHGWKVWSSEGDRAIREEVEVATLSIEPEETVGRFQEFRRCEADATRIIEDMLAVVDGAYHSLPNMGANRCVRMVLYAHNAARFDNVLLLKALRVSRESWSYRVQFFRGAVQRITYTPERCSRRIETGTCSCEVIFADTCLVFPARLGQLSKELGLFGGGKLDLDVRACVDVWITRDAWKAPPELRHTECGAAVRACAAAYPGRFVEREPGLEPDLDVYRYVTVYAVRDASTVLELAERQQELLEKVLNDVRSARGPREFDEDEHVRIPLGGVNTISGFSYVCTNAMLFPEKIYVPQGARAADINACMIGGHTEIHVQGPLLFNEGPMLGKGVLRQVDIDGMYCNIQRSKIFPKGPPAAMTAALAEALNAELAKADGMTPLERAALTLENYEAICGPVFGTFEVRMPRDPTALPSVGVLGMKLQADYIGETVTNQAWSSMPRRQRMTLIHALTFIRRGFSARIVSPDGTTWGTHFPEGLCAPFAKAMDLYLEGKSRSKREGKAAMAMVYKLVANGNFGQMSMQSTRPNSFQISVDDFVKEVTSKESRGDFELLNVTDVDGNMLMVRVRPNKVMHARPHQWGVSILAGAHSEFSDFAALFDPMVGVADPNHRPISITHGDTDSVFVPETLAIGCVPPGWWTGPKGEKQVSGSAKLSFTVDEKEPFGLGHHIIISKKKENILLNTKGEKEFVVAKGLSLDDLQFSHFADVFAKSASEPLTRTVLKKDAALGTITETTLTRHMREIPVLMGEKANSRKVPNRAKTDPLASGIADGMPPAVLYADLTSLLDLVRGHRPGLILKRVIFFNAQPLDFNDDGEQLGPPQAVCCERATDIVEVRWPKIIRPYLPGTLEAGYKVDLDRMQEAKATMKVCRDNSCRGERRTHPEAALSPL